MEAVADAVTGGACSLAVPPGETEPAGFPVSVFDEETRDPPLCRGSVSRDAEGW